eukprot:14625005-Alexandrium_andersonii.AAC.1
MAHFHGFTTIRMRFGSGEAEIVIARSIDSWSGRAQTLRPSSEKTQQSLLADAHAGDSWLFMLLAS